MSKTWRVRKAASYASCAARAASSWARPVTVEFAVGSAGTNYRRGTPRNPWDKANFRVPGGSSSGLWPWRSQRACALWPWALDTGGSVRGPRRLLRRLRPEVRPRQRAGRWHVLDEQEL
ncbi:amidase family protein [Cupriavidus basilensis]